MLRHLTLYYLIAGDVGDIALATLNAAGNAESGQRCRAAGKEVGGQVGEQIGQDLGKDLDKELGLGGLGELVGGFFGKKAGRSVGGDMGTGLVNMMDTKDGETGQVAGANTSRSNGNSSESKESNCCCSILSCLFCCCLFKMYKNNQLALRILIRYRSPFKETLFIYLNSGKRLFVIC